MPEPKTLGRIAYEAAYKDMGESYPWDRVPAEEQCHWEAAAAAVVKAHEERRWRPIETAPKDGTQLLLWEPGAGPIYKNYKVGKFIHANPRWVVGTNSYVIKPTHWQPLPEAPNA